MAGKTEPKPPITRVLAHYYGLELKATRGRVKTACPLPSHPDSNPSASVNIDGDRWSCFGCNISEDSYAVIMRERKCGFTEAKEFAASQFGGDLQDVPRDVRGKSGSGVRQSSRPGGRSGAVRTGIRRFGDTWA
ncbi:CHC2 zinc finger domain-containing protein [Streptomyces griseofuscus]|uniref:CHC2 zinc finger domain-containing protein n=1 Tax=Streptomyces griseofuscus TaxID=146922 RepID=UPI0036934D88